MVGREQTSHREDRGSHDWLVPVHVTKSHVASARSGSDPADSEKTSEGDGSIQSIVRCLALLRALNEHNGTSVQELAGVTRLPRGTVYRMLETLCAAGYVRKDSHTRGYWIESTCAELGKGFTDQSWILDTADRVITGLRDETKLAVVLTTPIEDTAHMLVRIATILRNPAGGYRTTAGTKVPMGHSSSGHCYLAHCAPAKTAQLLDKLYGNPDPSFVPFLHNHVSLPRHSAEKLLKLFRSQGYSMGHALNDSSGRLGVVAVPILRHGEVAGSLSLNFFYSSMKPAMLQNHIRQLNSAAALIGQSDG
jgi:IclR family mhp operon transcriptional activator